MQIKNTGMDFGGIFWKAQSPLDLRLQTVGRRFKSDNWLQLQFSRK
jgi:hypothetical protein